MRTYGRAVDPNTGKFGWMIVETAADGSNDYVYLTTLCQVLLLNLNESPFFANYGIPAHQSVAQQIAPDFYVAATQRQFAGFFASLVINKIKAIPPTYAVRVITNQGVKMEATVAI